MKNLEKSAMLRLSKQQNNLKTNTRTRSSSDVTSTSVNELSTVCSPISPKRIRVILPNQAKYRKLSYSNFDCESGSSTTCSSSTVGVTSRESRINTLVDKVAKELWIRGDSKLSTESSVGFIHVRSTAEWYVSLFKLEQDQDASLGQYLDEEIVLAAVFVAFKAADVIPGIGRVRMQQLLDAYYRVANTFILEGRVCEIEILIICLSGFDFQPFP